MADLFSKFTGQKVTFESGGFYLRGDPTVATGNITSPPKDVVLLPVSNWQDPNIIFKVEKASSGGYLLISTAPGANVYLWCAAVGGGVQNFYPVYARLSSTQKMDNDNGYTTWSPGAVTSAAASGYMFTLNAMNYCAYAREDLTVQVIHNSSFTVWTVGRVEILCTEITDVITTTLTPSQVDPSNICIFRFQTPHQTLSTLQVNTYYATDPKPATSEPDPYNAEEYDCNAFARSFQSHVMQEFYTTFPANQYGPAFGFAAVMIADPDVSGKTVGHSVNFYITPQLELKFIDPQNGKEFPLSEIISVQSFVM